MHAYDQLGVTLLDPLIDHRSSAHCSSFQNWILNFNATLDVYPTLNPCFGTSIRNVCPAQNKGKNGGAAMDSSTTILDNDYYKLLLQGNSLICKKVKDQTAGVRKREGKRRQGCFVKNKIFVVKGIFEILFLMLIWREGFEAKKNWFNSWNWILNGTQIIKK